MSRNKELGLTPLTRANKEAAFEWLRHDARYGVGTSRVHAEVAMRTWVQLVDRNKNLKLRVKILEAKLRDSRVASTCPRPPYGDLPGFGFGPDGPE